MKISDHIFMLEQQNDFGVVYPLLIIDGNELILIDTGFPGQFQSLRNAIEDSGFHVEDITGIILSHHHVDHIGSIKEIKAASPNLIVMVHEKELPYLKSGQISAKALDHFMGKKANFPVLKEQHRKFFDFFSDPAYRRVDADKTLSDGEILPFAGGMLVIHTPGHTPGHICLYIISEKLLFAGDAINLTDGKLTGAMGGFSQDITLADKSFEKALNYNPQTVICYHGGIYKNM